MWWNGALCLAPSEVWLPVLFAYVWTTEILSLSLQRAEISLSTSSEVTDSAQVRPCIPITHRFRWSKDFLYFITAPKRKCLLGGAEGKADSNLKEPHGIPSPTCAARLMTRLTFLLGILQQHCCIVVFT